MKNRRILRSLLMFFFVFCLLTTNLTPFALVEEASAITQADIDKLKKESDALADEKKKVEQELSEIKADKSNTLKRKSLLDQQIALLGAEIENTQEQIDKYEDLIVQTQSELRTAQEEEAEQYALFCQRVRAMEERGTISYWSVLFDAASFADLLSEIDFINEIMEADRRVIEDLKLLQQEISEKQLSLETSLAEQEAAKEALAQKNNALNDQRSEANALIRRIMENEEEYKATLDEIEAEEERTQQEIVRLSRELAAQQGNTKVTYGGYIWPVTTSKRITSPIGTRYTGIPGASTSHRGIDIGGVYWNSTVYAAKSGTVIVSGYNNVRGNYIVISHGSGNTTTYQHLSKRLVGVGANVKQGDKIGITGSTGVGSGPHLHFEITENGQIVDPLKYLTDYVKAWN